MKYHNITKADMLNGEGLRVVLWVSGCSHKCPGCQNALTWDPDDGVEFDDAAIKVIKIGVVVLLYQEEIPYFLVIVK